MYYGSGAGDFDDETNPKRGFPSGTSAAASDSPRLSAGPLGQSIHYIPQYNIYEPPPGRHINPNLRQAGASQAKSDDSTSQTSEYSGLREVLTKNLLGNKKKKSKKDDVTPIIHIGKVVINQAPSKRLGLYGIYGEPVYSPYPRDVTAKPPDPCVDPYTHARDYDSVPGYLGYGRSTDPTRAPVEQGSMSTSHDRPMEEHPETTAFLENVTPDGATGEETMYKTTEPEQTENSESGGRYARISKGQRENISKSTPLLNKGRLQFGMQFSPDDVNTEIPAQFDVSLKLAGSEHMIWRGQVTCDVKQRETLPKQSQETIRIKSSPNQNVSTSSLDNQRPPTVHMSSSPQYENFNPAFSGHEPYRIGNADDTTASAPAMMHRLGPSHTGESSRNFIKSQGQIWQQSRLRSFNSLSDDPQIGRNQSRTVVSRHPAPNEKLRTNNCNDDFNCLGDGYHDVMDELELGHIKECMQQTGKIGHWIVTRLEDHPLFRYCLFAKLNDTVAHFPIMFTKKKKFKINPEEKGFKCICKMITHYQTNKLPGVNKFNLKRDHFPLENIPPPRMYSNSSDEMREQFTNFTPKANTETGKGGIEVTPL